MFLHNKQTGTLVEILDVEALFNPTQDAVTVQGQVGEEEQEPEPCAKELLIFPSGENLPRCWVDANYRMN
jgi:hypothetical protein